MPLPFALDHINLWLLDDDGGVAIVDTGAGLPETRALWDTLLASELDGRPVTRVIVTHFHPDHIGNAGWLVGRTGVDLWCTDAEWLASQIAWRTREPAEIEKRLVHYRRHGLDEATIERFRRRGNHYPGLVPTLAPDYQRLAEGDVLTIGGRRWDVFTVHGHAPDHACLWNRDDDVLIAGDQVLPKITTNVSVWPDRPRENPLRQYLDSLERFDPMDVDTLVLPSHGLPFRGLHARLAALRQHHDARLHETIGALAAPRTGAELIPVLFRRELDVHQLGFAIGEVLAHLHLLESDGAVMRLTGADDVERFRRA
ncbi:MAG: MBL fold metallo-hydrolase [Candidatus Rokubacteria bacterium]|nr:MBL fold metallo-hydrolase [Candidatus Rokubacteria bacterium]